MASLPNELVADGEELVASIPDEIVKALDLRDGDEVVIRVVGDRLFDIARRQDVSADGGVPAPDWIDLREDRSRSAL